MPLDDLSLQLQEKNNIPSLLKENLNHLGKSIMKVAKNKGT